MSKKVLILFIFIIIIGFLLRLYRFDSPIADWHSWRQADTSSVSRNFVSKGFSVLRPTYHDLSNVPSGKDNPNGYRFVEFPIYNVSQAGLYKIVGILTLEQWGRMVSIISSLFSITFIFLLLRKYQNALAGLVGAFFFAVLPYSVFYGRAVLPDTSTAAVVLAGIYFFDLWISNYSKTVNVKTLMYFILAIIFTATAFLLKPFALFFTIPMIYLAVNKFGKKVLINPYLWVFAIISLLPLAGWRVWMTQFPEGIPANAWLFNEGNIRFKGSFFYWVFAERIGKLMLGYWGVSLFVLGVISRVKNNSLFFYSFLLSSVLYLTIVARGNVQHDYYQILILPTVCIFLGLGGEFLLNNSKNFSYKYLGPIVFGVITIFTLIFSWYYVRDYFNINNRSIVAAGEAVDRLTPKDALVIANYEGDTTFLYQTKRSGWASYTKEIPQLIEMGADFLVIADPTESDLNFAQSYEIIEQSPQYIIFNLRKSP